MKTNLSINSSLDEGSNTSASDILRNHGIHFLNGELDNDIAHDVIIWILESNLRKPRHLTHLTLMINSEGGSMNCAFAIIDVMRGSKLPIHTVGLGQISSCGLLIFIAGEQGHRVLTPNTSIMSHIWEGGSYGKAHELISAQRDYDLTTTRMMEHYRLCTGLDLATLKEKLLPPHDVFLSAEEARALNICDDIRYAD